MKVEQGQSTRAIIVKSSGDTPKDKVRIRIPSIHGPTSRDKLPPELQGFRAGYVADEELPTASVLLPVGTQSPGDVSSLFQDKEIVYIMWTSTRMNSALVIGTTGVVVKDE